MNFDYILEKIQNLENCETLDVFAREGDWQSYKLVSKVKSIEAWEIEEKFIHNLRKNLPEAIVHCRDSIKFINSATNYKKFDLIIIDNGLNCYGEDLKYCEHFDFIKNLYKFFNEKCFVVFNVVLKPFNYEKFPEWNDRRNSFYDVMNSSALDKNFIENFYKDLFKSVGYKTKNYYSICRETHEGVDYLYYVGMELEKE
jgi:hypothetical protein